MNIFINTKHRDLHALTVQLALERMDCNVRCFFAADQPMNDLKNSIYMDNENYRWVSREKYQEYFIHEYDIIWWRRPKLPYIEKALVHSDDYDFVKRENELFFESLTYNLAPNAWWINKKDAARRANAKLFQLRMAVDSALIIPKTLISNDYTEIKDFFNSYKSQGIIYKTFAPHCWDNKDNVRMSYTSRIGIEDLPPTEVLKNTPGIFQCEIPKSYELRIMYFGSYIYAVKINSQVHEDGLIDWRIVTDGRLEITPYLLPKSVENSIKLFMAKLDLSFGCLDFIVTPDGEYIFLEVNEQGQFLWIEEHNPDIKILDMFVNFLLYGAEKSRYMWNPKTVVHHLEMYSKALENILSKENMMY